MCVNWEWSSLERMTQAGSLHPSYFAVLGSPSDANSKYSPPVCTSIVPGPSGLLLLGKKTAPSVDSPELSLVGMKAIAEAAAPALRRADTPSASALWRRVS